MNRRYLVALSFFIAVAITACAGGGVTETPPVFRHESAREPRRSACDDHAARQRSRDSAARRTRADLRRHGDRRSRRRALERRAVTIPSARTFTPTGSMTVARAGQTITMLRDGRVLLTGGVQNAGFRSRARRAPRFTIQPPALSARPDRCRCRAKDIRRRCFATGACSSSAAAPTASTRWLAPRFTILRAARFSRTGHLHQPRVAHVAALLGTRQSIDRRRRPRRHAGRLHLVRHRRNVRSRKRQVQRDPRAHEKRSRRRGRGQAERRARADRRRQERQNDDEPASQYRFADAAQHRGDLRSRIKRLHQDRRHERAALPGDRDDARRRQRAGRRRMD